VALIDHDHFGIEVVATPNLRWAPFFTYVMRVRTELESGRRKGWLTEIGVAGGNLGGQHWSDD